MGLRGIVWVNQEGTSLQTSPSFVRRGEGRESHGNGLCAFIQVSVPGTPPLWVLFGPKPLTKGRNQTAESLARTPNGLAHLSSSTFLLPP